MMKFYINVFKRTIKFFSAISNFKTSSPGDNRSFYKNKSYLRQYDLIKQRCKFQSYELDLSYKRAMRNEEDTKFEISKNNTFQDSDGYSFSSDKYSSIHSFISHYPPIFNRNNSKSICPKKTKNEDSIFFEENSENISINSDKSNTINSGTNHSNNSKNDNSFIADIKNEKSSTSIKKEEEQTNNVIIIEANPNQLSNQSADINAITKLKENITANDNIFDDFDKVEAEIEDKYNSFNNNEFADILQSEEKDDSDNLDAIDNLDTKNNSNSEEIINFMIEIEEEEMIEPNNKYSEVIDLNQYTNSDPKITTREININNNSDDADNTKKNDEEEETDESLTQKEEPKEYKSTNDNNIPSFNKSNDSSSNRKCNWNGEDNNSYNINDHSKSNDISNTNDNEKDIPADAMNEDVTMNNNENDIDNNSPFIDDGTKSKEISKTNDNNNNTKDAPAAALIEEVIINDSITNLTNDSPNIDDNTESKEVSNTNDAKDSSATMKNEALIKSNNPNDKTNKHNNDFIENNEEYPKNFVKYKANTDLNDMANSLKKITKNCEPNSKIRNNEKDKNPLDLQVKERDFQLKEKKNDETNDNQKNKQDEKQNDETNDNQITNEKKATAREDKDKKHKKHQRKHKSGFFSWFLYPFSTFILSYSIILTIIFIIFIFHKYPN